MFTASVGRNGIIFRLGKLGGKVGEVLSLSSKGSASRILGFVCMINGLGLLVKCGDVLCRNVDLRVVLTVVLGFGVVVVRLLVFDLGFAVVVGRGVVVVDVVVVGFLVVLLA